MPTCPECGTEQGTGRFCGRCGAVIAPRGGAPPDPLDRPFDEPESASWGRRSWLVWIAGTLLVVLVGVLVAVTTGADEQPSSDPGVAGPAEPPSPATPIPPRPVTTVGDCTAEGPPGCTRWHLDLPGAVAITAAARGGDARHAYLGATFADGSGALYAIDPTNGIQLWRRGLPGAVRQPVVTAHGPVAVVFDEPSGGTGVATFDPDTGELRRHLARDLPWRASVPPVAVGPLVAVAGPGGMLVARTDDGATTRIELPGVPDQLLAADVDDPVFVVVNAGGGILAHDGDGAFLWKTSGSTLGTGAEAGRSAVLDRPGQVVGIDVRRGETWRTRLQATDVPPAVDDGEVLVTTREGQLVRLDLASGAELGRYPWPVEVGAIGLTRHEGVLYIPTCSGMVAADAPDGQRRWSTELEAPFGTCAEAPTVIPDGNVLVSAGVRLYGLHP